MLEAGLQVIAAELFTGTLFLLALAAVVIIVRDFWREWSAPVKIVDFGDCGHRGWLPAEEAQRLQSRVGEQRRQLRIANEALRTHVLQLDALHWVWCDGGCRGGIHRWGGCELTEEMVVMAEKNTRRMRQWYENRQGRKAWGTKG